MDKYNGGNEAATEIKTLRVFIQKLSLPFISHLLRCTELRRGLDSDKTFRGFISG
jgi:hypothetical protein